MQNGIRNSSYYSCLRTRVLSRNWSCLRQGRTTNYRFRSVACWARNTNHRWTCTVSIEVRDHNHCPLPVSRNNSTLHIHIRGSLYFFVSGLGLKRIYMYINLQSSTKCLYLKHTVSILTASTFSAFPIPILGALRIRQRNIMW